MENSSANKPNSSSISSEIQKNEKELLDFSRIPEDAKYWASDDDSDDEIDSRNGQLIPTKFYKELWSEVDITDPDVLAFQKRWNELPHFHIQELFKQRHETINLGSLFSHTHNPDSNSFILRWVVVEQDIKHHQLIYHQVAKSVQIPMTKDEIPASELQKIIIDTIINHQRIDNFARFADSIVIPTLEDPPHPSGGLKSRLAKCYTDKRISKLLNLKDKNDKICKGDTIIYGLFVNIHSRNFMKLVNNVLKMCPKSTLYYS
jgi:hypothetical protein